MRSLYYLAAIWREMNPSYLTVVRDVEPRIKPDWSCSPVHGQRTRVARGTGTEMQRNCFDVCDVCEAITSQCS